MMIALTDQHAIARRKLLEAFLEGGQSGVEGGVQLLAFPSQALEQLAGEIPLTADIAVALLEDLKLGESKGPGQKRFGRVVLSEFAVEGDAGFLENVAGVLFVGHERKDVAEDVFLVPRQQPDQQLRAGVVHRTILASCAYPGPARSRPSLIPTGRVIVPAGEAMNPRPRLKSRRGEGDVSPSFFRS